MRGRRRSSGPRQRLKEASKAFKRERFEEARKILRPLAEQAPTAESVRELLGLTYYRLGRWKPAAAELEAFRDLSGTTEQHPVLADCYRALGRHAKVAELWEELRAASPGAALVAEGRIVAAGSLADQGRLDDAIAAPRAPPSRRRSSPKEHHLRVTYALADLYERAGDVPEARQLFGIVAAADPELGDVDGSPARAALTLGPDGCHTPSVGSASFPLHVRTPHRRRHPCPPPPSPPGTNLTILVGTLSRDAGAPHAALGRPAWSPSSSPSARRTAGRVRPVAWLGAPASGRRLGRRARSCSSPGRSAAASSGPAGPPRAAPRWWRPPPSPPGGAAAAGKALAAALATLSGRL